MWDIKHFWPYLYGKKFKVASDHKSLTWIMSVKDPGSRLLRWRIELEEYDYELVYKPGMQNSLRRHGLESVHLDIKPCVW